MSTYWGSSEENMPLRWCGFQTVKRNRLLLTSFKYRVNAKLRFFFFVQDKTTGSPLVRGLGVYGIWTSKTPAAHSQRPTPNSRGHWDGGSYGLWGFLTHPDLHTFNFHTSTSQLLLDNILKAPLNTLTIIDLIWNHCDRKVFFI